MNPTGLLHQYCRVYHCSTFQSTFPIRAIVAFQMTRRHQLQITLTLMIEQVICPSYRLGARFELAVERRRSNQFWLFEKNQNFSKCFQTKTLKNFRTKKYVKNFSN